jgi:Saxitoxin biosynthesis operon protein SxtJ
MPEVPSVDRNLAPNEHLRAMSTHEDFKRELHGAGPSDRSFGFVFTVAFLLLGVVPLRHGRPVRLWCLAVSGAVFLITLIRPALLHRANQIWTRFGKLLGKVVNPIVTALLFFLVFTPAAVILRWLGKDLLGLALDSEAKTYWKQRDESGPESSMVNQF